jgi:hypothetical protein
MRSFDLSQSGIQFCPGQGAFKGLRCRSSYVKSMKMRCLRAGDRPSRESAAKVVLLLTNSWAIATIAHELSSLNPGAHNPFCELNLHRSSRSQVPIASAGIRHQAFHRGEARQHFH